MLYDYTIFPLECMYKVAYLGFYELLHSYGLALIFLSLATHILLAPLIEWGKSFQKEESCLQEILQPQIEEINANLHGLERHKELTWLYRRYGYHPAMAIRSAMTVLVQLPFLMAAYFMLSNLMDIEGVSFGVIRDLSEPDGLLGGANFLPLLMTAINFGATARQKNFSRRDKIQGFVVAIMFLLLLYDAPAALLIYWTGNNLWSALATFGGQPVILPLVARGITAVLVPLTLAATLCLFVPIDIYLSNADEIWFSLPDIFPYLLAATLVLTLILYMPGRFLLPRRKNLYRLVLFGLTLCLFLQSYLLNLNYGVFIGAEIQWDKYHGPGMINTFIWLAVLALVVRYGKLWIAYPHRMRSFFSYGCTFVLIAQIIPLCYVGATKPIDKHFRNVLTTKNMLNVSANDNIIVIVLDMFDTRFFQKIQEENPELVAELDGFTYYPDAVSLFGVTDYSMPQMLTGKVYDNTQTYSDYIKKAWRETTFYKLLEANNYDVGIYTSGSYVASGTNVTNLIPLEEQIIAPDYHTAFVYGKLTLFRSLPHFLKKFFVIYSGDLFQSSDNKDQVYRENDIKFYREVSAGLNICEDKNSFRWYHLTGAHMPYNLTSDLRLVPQSTVQEQSVGCFKIALQYLRQMKEKGIYNRATVLILADHGKHSFNENDNFDKIKPVPLLLVKQPGASGDMRISPNAVSYGQLLAAMAHRFPQKQYEYGVDVDYGQDSRHFYRVQDNNHEIIEYVVFPNALDNNSWHWAKVIDYKPNKKFERCKVNKKIDFRYGFDGEKYLGHGWCNPEKYGAYSNGDHAEINFYLDNLKADKDLILHTDIGPVYDESHRFVSQEISVYINGQKLNTLLMEQSYLHKFTTRVPRHLLIGSNITIKFTVSNPTEVWDVAYGHRSLGFFIQSMTLTYAN